GRLVGARLRGRRGRLVGGGLRRAAATGGLGLLGRLRFGDGRLRGRRGSSLVRGGLGRAPATGGLGLLGRLRGGRFHLGRRSLGGDRLRRAAAARLGLLLCRRLLGSRLGRRPVGR